MNSMKYFIFIFLLSIVGFSCSEDDVKELLSTDQTLTASESFDIDIDEDDPLTYTDSETIEASVAGIEITEVEILSLNATITNVLAPEAVNLTTASLVFEGTGVQLDFPETELTTGATFELASTIPQNVIDALEAKLLADEEVTINATATVDGAPINFTISIDLEIKVTGTVG